MDLGPWLRTFSPSTPPAHLTDAYMNLPECSHSRNIRSAPRSLLPVNVLVLHLLLKDRCAWVTRFSVRWERIINHELDSSSVKWFAQIKMVLACEEGWLKKFYSDQYQSPRAMNWSSINIAALVSRKLLRKFLREGFPCRPYVLRSMPPTNNNTRKASSRLTWRPSYLQLITCWRYITSVQLVNVTSVIQKAHTCPGKRGLILIRMEALCKSVQYHRHKKLAMAFYDQKHFITCEFVIFFEVSD